MLLKARSGGGGRGIRLVNSEKDLRGCFHGAERGAVRFRDGALYREVPLPVKHVEVQSADNFGLPWRLGRGTVQFSEKPKAAEESPAGAHPKKRKELFEFAKKAAKAVGYRNAGTVEF